MSLVFSYLKYYVPKLLGYFSLSTKSSHLYSVNDIHLKHSKVYFCLYSIMVCFFSHPSVWADFISILHGSKSQNFIKIYTHKIVISAMIFTPFPSLQLFCSIPTSSSQSHFCFYIYINKQNPCPRAIY